MDKQTFYQGEMPEDFLADFKDNRNKFEQLLKDSELSPDQLQQLSGLPTGLNVVVIAEPWSGDVLYNLPPLLRLAQARGWNVRIFRRDRFPDMILPYRKEGVYHSIPVFIFYDPQFHELGHWIERPASATRIIDEESLKLRRRLREEHQHEWRQDEIQELVSLLRR